MLNSWAARTETTNHSRPPHTSQTPRRTTASRHTPHRHHEPQPAATHHTEAMNQSRPPHTAQKPRTTAGQPPHTAQTPRTRASRHTPHRNHEPQPAATHLRRADSNWNADLNIKRETMILLEDNPRENLDDLGFSNDFFPTPPMHDS